MEITDRIAVVTGAASGIGKALSLALHAAGAKKVVCADLNGSGAADTARQIDGAAKGLEGLADDTQLASLPSLLTLDVLDGAADQPSRAYHDLTPFSFGVLADVREGGLKRDLSVLLERPIPQSASAVGRESGDDYMLYKFNTKDSWSSGSHPQEAVPIHDLASATMAALCCVLLMTPGSPRHSPRHHTGR